MMRGIGKSLSQMSIKHFVFVVFALLALIPALTLVRIGLLVAVPDNPNSLDLPQILALAVFLVMCQVTGLVLLVSYSRRISALSASSRQVKQQSLAVAGGGAADGDLVFGDSEGSANELETLTEVLTRLQEDIAGNLGRLHDQAAVLQRLDVLLDHVGEMVIVADTHNTVVYANRAARQRLGVMPERPLRQAIAEGTVRPDAQSAWAEALESWTAREEERSFRSVEGTASTFSLQVIVYPPAGENRSKFIVLRDVGERKRLEHQLYASEKLASLGQIISGVAHELNNPLAAILGFAELCRDSALNRNDLGRNLEIIEREARRTAHIVENLLSFSRRRAPQRGPASLHDLLDRCLEMLGYILKSKNVNVRRDYAPAMPAIIVDEYQMQQVFMNILINAAQAMESARTPAPEILVRTRVREDGQGVSVQLADNGPGIPAENLRRVFDPFFTTKPETEGTGLGLAVSLGIVKEHGGTVAVQSPGEGGVGASFTVQLPVSAPSATDTQTRILARQAAKAKLRGRVLVVDDEPGVLQMTRQVLSGLGLDIETHASFIQAKAAVTAREFDMFLVDFYMTDGTGKEFWQFLSAHRPQWCSRVVFMTGDPQIGSQMTQECGCEAPFLLKPFHLEDLREAVSTCLAAKLPAAKG